MASVHQRSDSQYWYCSFRIPIVDPDTGEEEWKQFQRNTRKTERKKAERAAEEIEDATRKEYGAGTEKSRKMLALLREATEEALRGTLSEVHRPQVPGGPLRHRQRRRARRLLHLRMVRGVEGRQAPHGQGQHAFAVSAGAGQLCGLARRAGLQADRGRQLAGYPSMAGRTQKRGAFGKDRRPVSEVGPPARSRPPLPKGSCPETPPRASSLSPRKIR